MFKIFARQVRHVQSFRPMGLNSNLLANIASNRILVPTDIQANAIPTVLSGETAIVLGETGSGKSLSMMNGLIYLSSS